jgi:hypothetical protein
LKFILFISGLLNDAITGSHFIELNDKLESKSKEAVVA